jgi:rSAM/selenodomain-associated transferase 1
VNGSDEALALFAKEPHRGRVKTRLCPPLSPGEAARFYSCLLADTAEEVSSLKRVRRYLFLDPPDSVERVARGPFAEFERLPQRGADLGARMLDAASLAVRRGARRVVIVGADCPALSSGHVRRAFRELREGAGAVFGPSADGGYYLVGLSWPDPRLFEGIPWGTGAVLRETVARCRAACVTYSFLPPERDVDTQADLRALRAWAASRALPRCRRTREWLRDNARESGRTRRIS